MSLQANAPKTEVTMDNRATTDRMPAPNKSVYKSACRRNKFSNCAFF
ncbi:MAG: hypothetical protein WCG93_14310 [Paludibacter sp.]